MPTASGGGLRNALPESAAVLDHGRVFEPCARSPGASRGTHGRQEEAREEAREAHAKTEALTSQVDVNGFVMYAES
jgi:hypothetical protein